MAKRSFHAEHEEDESQSRKKVKLQEQTLAKDDVPITSARLLKALLTFHQDDVGQYRINLQRFRRHLEDLSSSKSGTLLEDGVLLEYLERSITTTATDQTEIIPDLFQAWRYAVQVYDEGLVPMIPGVLAVLLQAISSSLRFVEIGVRICRTLMRRENAQLFQKSMNSARTRDTTIARCLDLLTQVVSFDGGSCAKGVWLQRGITMSRLPHLMAMSKKTIYGAAQSTSVRDHAIPFLLANLRYQDQEAKAEILSNRKTVQNMLREILSEPVNVVTTILSAIKQYVVEDEHLGRAAKGHLLTDYNLGYVLGIMRQSGENDEWDTLRDLAEEILTETCTSRIHGIVYKQNGWYPPGTEEATLNEDIPFFGGVIEAADMTKYESHVSVRNTTLAAFIQDLRPWASPLECKLILGIFRAAPELIADYFLRKKTFSFEPKLTITWIGWASLMCSVIRLPSPSYEKYLDGAIRQPPPIPVVMQSILPQSLTSQALNKAIKQPIEIIRLFTIKILIAAFEKLKQVLSSFQAVSSPSIWRATAVGILREFSSRCPEYAQVLNIYKSLAQDKHILREATSSLLSMYHSIAPQFINDTKFDASASITKTLNQVVNENDQCNSFTLLELQHLLLIGNSVIEGKWWQKLEKATTSTLTTILRLLTSARLNRNEKLKTLVKSILEENFVIHSSQNTYLLDALLESLATLDKSLTKDAIYGFLDECILRLVRKPVKYYGDVDDIVEEGQDDSVISPLFMVLLEQWPFFVKSHTTTENVVCAEWICSYMVCSAKVGQAKTQLQKLRAKFTENVDHKDIKRIFRSCKSELSTEQQRYAVNGASEAKKTTNGISLPSQNAKELSLASFDSRLALPKEAEDYPVLNRWQGKPIQEAVMDGHISDLIYCLGSSYQEIRLQGAAALKLLTGNVPMSKYEERQSLYLLLGILQETISEHGISNQLPSIAIALAARSVKVLSSPLHPMYTKVNHFLSRAPVWNLAKLPSYWMDRIFSKPPTQPEARWKEVAWLLDLLLDGLRSTDDTNLYRRTGVFERLLVNCTATNAPRGIYEKTIDIFYRCALVGGATTLITRFGILAWIASQKLVHPKDETILLALETKIRHTCDAKRVLEWSDGNIRCDRDQSGSHDDAVGDEKLADEHGLDSYESLQLVGQSASAEAP